MNKITVKDALEKKDAVLIDARSEKEYAEDHIAGAINLPILDNEERHIVGFIYKQVNQDDAYAKGYEFFEKKKEELKKLLKKYENKKLLVYCARGGMRSKAMTEFLTQVGLDATQIEGGYKSYREIVRDEIKGLELPKIFVISGLTGSGKTELIKKLKNHVDLEGLAGHKSSIFGMIGQTPVSQKMFETKLLSELQKNRKYIIFEGESRKIGDVFIPENIYKAMQEGINIKLVIPIDLRAQRIVDEYFDTEKNVEEVRSIIPKLKQALGGEKIKIMLDLIKKKDYHPVAKMLLEDYYDLKYSHTVENKKYQLIVEETDLEEAKTTINKFCSDLIVSN